MNAHKILPPSMTDPTAPLPHLQLGISTNIALHPDFPRYPLRFSAARGLNLVQIPRPSTVFSTNRDSNERNARRKLNIHLVCHGAIRLFATCEREEQPWEIKTIELDPSRLLNCGNGAFLIQQDLMVALDTLRQQIAPLLADPRDVCHAIPGLVDGAVARAYWRNVTTSLTFPGVCIDDLHNVAHPDAGRAEGTTRKRMQLGGKDDDIIISFKAVKASLTDQPTETPPESLQVSLSVKGPKLVAIYGNPGMTASMGNPSTLRLIKFLFSDFTAAYQHEMNRLEGIHLPVPERRPADGRSVTLPRAKDLMSFITSIPAEELSAMCECICRSQKHKKKSLKKDAQTGATRLTPVPVKSLFLPTLNSLPKNEIPISHQVADPEIIAAYGSILVEPGVVQSRR